MQGDRRPAVNNDAVAVDPQRAMMIRLECFNRAGVNLGDLPRAVQLAIEADIAPRPLVASAAAAQIASMRFLGPSDCG